MAKKRTKERIREPKILSTHTRTIVWRVSDSVKKRLISLGLPPTLYLHVSGNVEWTIFSGHAWGRASVSSDPGGGQPYAVQQVCLRIVMNTPDQQNSQTCANNAAQNDNDVKWVGTSPIFAGPHSLFVATATDPNYGTWSASCEVY